MAFVATGSRLRSSGPQSDCSHVARWPGCRGPGRSRTGWRISSGNTDAHAGHSQDSKCLRGYTRADDFDSGAELQQWNAANRKARDVGDISADCTPDFTVTPQSITCDLSAGTPALPIPGDYLLTVSTEPTGTSYGKWFSPDWIKHRGHFDHWDLTIGAVGPQGPAGPQGPPGTVGLAGQQCPAGESVIGFNSSGNIICSSTTPPPPLCSTTVFDFTTTSSGGGAFSQAAWTDGTLFQSQASNTACTVTVNQPSGAVDLVGGTVGATSWSINSFTGYSSCVIDTVSQPDCSGLSLSISEPVVDNYPTCTSGLCDLGTCSTGVATADLSATCIP
jgi:hypothetical protein